MQKSAAISELATMNVLKSIREAAAPYSHAARVTAPRRRRFASLLAAVEITDQNVAVFARPAPEIIGDDSEPSRRFRAGECLRSFARSQAM